MKPKTEPWKRLLLTQQTVSYSPSAPPVVPLWCVSTSSIVATASGSLASSKPSASPSKISFFFPFSLILDCGDVHVGHYRPQYVPTKWSRHSRFGQSYPISPRHFLAVLWHTHPILIPMQYQKRETPPSRCPVLHRCSPIKNRA